MVVLPPELLECSSTIEHVGSSNGSSKEQLAHSTSHPSQTASKGLLGFDNPSTRQTGRGGRRTLYTYVSRAQVDEKAERFGQVQKQGK